MRRKYHFKNRAEAEAAWRETRDEVWRCQVAIHALCEGRIDRWYTAEHAREYSIALVDIDRADGGCVLFRFAPDGQRPTVNAFSVDAIRSWHRALCRTADTQEQRSIRHMLGHALTDVNALLAVA